MVLSTTDFLKNAQKSFTLSHHQQKMDFLNTQSYEVPFIDKLEVRTRTEKNDLEQQQYQIRLSPTGRKERRAYRQFHQSTIAYETTEKQAILQEELINRYNLLIDWWDFLGSISLLQQQQLVIEDRIIVLKQQALMEEFQIVSLIDAENALHEVQQNILKKQLRQQRLEKAIQRDLNLSTSLTIDTSNWLSFINLKKAVNILTTMNASHTKLVQRQSELELIKSEENLESARNKKWLDFVEARYQNDPKDPFSEEFSIGLGIEIPFKNQALLDLNELGLERLEVQNELILIKEELTNGIIEIQEKLELIFQQHALITQQIQDSQAQFSFDQFKTTTNIDPLALLKIQEGLLKRQSSLQKLEAEAYELYVEMLELTGKVVELPLRNYLQEGFEAF